MQHTYAIMQNMSMKGAPYERRMQSPPSYL